MIPDISLEALIELCVMILALTGLGADAPDYPEHGIVTDVVDGDTIKIENSGKTYTVRLLGVDTPETSGAIHPSEFKENSSATCLRTYASTSKNFVKQEVLDKKISLEYDNFAGKKDSYGRHLAIVTYGDNNLNKQLLENGYARFYEEESYVSTRREQYNLTSYKAKKNQVGLWGC